MVEIDASTRSPNLSSTSCDLDPWPPDPQSWLFMSLPRGLLVAVDNKIVFKISNNKFGCMDERTGWQHNASLQLSVCGGIKIVPKFWGWQGVRESLWPKFFFGSLALGVWYLSQSLVRLLLYLLTYLAADLTFVSAGSWMYLSCPSSDDAAAELHCASRHLLSSLSWRLLLWWQATHISSTSCDLCSLSSGGKCLNKNIIHMFVFGYT